MRENMKGQRLGTLVILGNFQYKYYGKKRIVYEQVKCDCGKIYYTRRDHLRGGRIKNCGCEKAYRISLIAKANAIHNMEGTVPYKKYCSLKQRCVYKKCSSYYRYGGRGIKCEWKDFKEFRKDMGESYEKHLKEYGQVNTTIDRVNNDGNYCKENCKWSTLIEQANNKSNSKYVTYNGEILTVTQMARKYNKNERLIKERLHKQGWTIQEAIETKLLNKSERLHTNK